MPDVSFGLYGELVVFDHVDKTIKVIANADLPAHGGDALTAAYADACRRVDVLVARLGQTPPGRLGEIDPTGPVTLPFTSNQTREQFESAVRAKGIEYIKAGDIFQFVPSQRLRVRSPADPFDVYRALRIINPSPFMFYLKSPATVLIGSSPEILCRVVDGVSDQPAAGRHPPARRNRRRGRGAGSRAAGRPKDRAEHIMLVDLHRNDVGRVAAVGSVTVSERMTVERYSHVMHITTNVSGTLAQGKSAMDALRVSLPVGTVSGAPKIRAMQIIDEVEPTRRGPYAGGVGYLDFAGNLDTCIALRTIVWKATSGGGIVRHTSRRRRGRRQRPGLRVRRDGEQGQGHAQGRRDRPGRVLTFAGPRDTWEPNGTPPGPFAARAGRSHGVGAPTARTRTAAVRSAVAGRDSGRERRCGGRSSG